MVHDLYLNVHVSSLKVKLWLLTWLWFYRFVARILFLPVQVVSTSTRTGPLPKRSSHTNTEFDFVRDATMTPTTKAMMMMMVDDQGGSGVEVDEPGFPLEQLCDDELALMLTYCDFDTAVRVARLTSRTLRQRLYDRSNNNNMDSRDSYALVHAWKTIHHRHGFASSSLSPSCSSTRTFHDKCNDDYLESCRHGRQLDQNLFQDQRQQRHHKMCFNLPHRRFHFVPILPPPLGWNEEDPPPVDWDCHSFQLTSTGRGGEFILLHPFDDSLSVHHLGDSHIMRRSMFEVVPSQTLFDAGCDESMQDWRDYYVAASRQQQQQQQQHHMPTRNPRTSNLDLEVWNLGVDARPLLQVDAILSFHYQQVGTMVVYGRSFSYETQHQHQLLQPMTTANNSGYCTELMVWLWRYQSNPTALPGSSSLVPEKWICRLPCGVGSMDVCPMTNRLFVRFLPGDGPTHNGLPRNSERWVAAYPLLPYGSSNNNHDSHFWNQRERGLKYAPEPQFILECKHDVSMVKVDPSGTIVMVGTAQRTLEIWKILDGGSSHSSPFVRRVQILDIPVCIQNKITHLADQMRASLPSDNDVGVVESPPTLEVPPRNERFYRMPSPHPEPVEALYHAPHLSLTVSGFVTLQHSRTDGSTLLVWMGRSEDEKRFEVVSQINLPLSPQCKPSVHYDGRRLIVFGKDHIGMIILVYHVLTSLESIHKDDGGTETSTPASTKKGSGGDESAGISNWTYPPRVRFANRIRHVALGGLGSFDSLYMTCNERYVMVNTKSGHLLNNYHNDYAQSNQNRSALFAADGLLVIDLDDDDS